MSDDDLADVARWRVVVDDHGYSFATLDEAMRWRDEHARAAWIEPSKAKAR